MVASSASFACDPVTWITAARESMWARKRTKYAKSLPDLEAEGVEYKPLIWSCWGREHENTSTVLVALCRRAARRRGDASWRSVLRGFRADVGAILARRASAMWRVCTLPHSPGPPRA